MINDAQIRQLMILALPAIVPGRLEISLFNYDQLAGYNYRDGHNTFQGTVIALHKSEPEIATELAGFLARDIIGETIAAIERSPYEGKRGKHPKACTCSKHLKAVDGKAQ